MKSKTVIFLIGILFVLANCTVQKRTVNKGFYVKWHHSLRTESKKELPTKNIVSNKTTNSFVVDSIKEKNQVVNTEILSEFDSKISSTIDKPEIESVENPQIIFNNDKTNNTSLKQPSVKPNSSSVKTKTKEEKEKKDLALRIHQLFTISIASMFIGLICFFIAFSTNYINWAVIPGALFGIGGYFLFLFCILLLLYYLIFKRKKAEKPNKETRLKYKKLIRIDLILLVIAGLILVIVGTAG